MKKQEREQSELSPLAHLFESATRTAVVEKSAPAGEVGETSTIRISRARLWWLWQKHQRGITRFGLSPVRDDGTCRWGAIDLDAHDDGDGDRTHSARSIIRGLRRLGVTPYLARSRRGRGWHVIVFFREPGAGAGQLHRVLAALAASVADADIRPSGGGGGQKLYMPGFKGAPLLDADFVPVDPRHVEPDDPDLITVALGPQPTAIPESPIDWRRNWSRPAVGGGDCLRGLEDVQHLLFRGPSGLWQAESGARARLAGRVAAMLPRQATRRRIRPSSRPRGSISKATLDGFQSGFFY